MSGTCPKCGQPFQQKLDFPKRTVYAHDIKNERKDCVVPK